MSRSYRQMIEHLADGLYERELVSKECGGMDAVIAALQAIDDLTEELDQLRGSIGTTS